ncbi:tyrosine-type recombinase/integrase, partial [Bacteroides heparinolyticus]
MWLKFRRQKTNTLCRVKLLPQVVALLDTYSSDERNTLLPNISYETYRFLLKTLQLRAVIAIPSTTHVGRHSFGTPVLEAGVPIENIAKMTGHASIASTQIYA